jgi:hypothetical protein
MSPPPRDSPSIRTDDERNAKRHGVRDRCRDAEDEVRRAQTAVAGLRMAKRGQNGVPPTPMSGNPSFERYFTRAGTLEWIPIFLPLPPTNLARSAPARAKLGGGDTARIPD